MSRTLPGMCWLVLLFAGCGGTQMLEMRTIEKAPAPVVGPKATPEEVDGSVPALKGIVGTIPLVPEELVPPEPPADPVPEFEE